MAWTPGDRVPPISKPTSYRKPWSRVRKSNLHSDRGQDSNPCAWRPLRAQSTHGSTVPRRRCPVHRVFMYVDGRFIRDHKIQHDIASPSYILLPLIPKTPHTSLHKVIHEVRKAEQLAGTEALSAGWAGTLAL
ncbi:hypothetical protein E2C01_021476 [Portunus trituberculatus]|uniref:Uncharacterized protein n=1 Tax=Portunus trituberculatus TaxID=210409 RepID=A0A5B7E513_PORTR|nr:hypothetical protein [Portunus trituberculatus]